MIEKVLTIIIPMYQARPWIRKCLRSLLVDVQKRKDLEVIVVNDGSLDGCEEDAWEYVKKYPDMFRFLQKENGGHGSAVNAGVGISTGAFVKILDADDWMDTGELEVLLDELRSFCAGQMEPDVVFSGYQTFHVLTEKTERICAGIQVHSSGGWTDLKELTARWKQYRPVCTFHGITYRTAFYRESCAGLPEGVCYDDAYYAIVPASHAKRIFVSGSCPYVYRIGDSGQSVSAQNRVRRLADARRVAQAVCATMQQSRPPGGQAYWEYRTESFLADYLITCFLRYRDKRAGRVQARRFMGKLQRRYPVLADRMRGRYRALKCLGFLRVGEKQLARCLWLRQLGQNGWGFCMWMKNK